MQRLRQLLPGTSPFVHPAVPSAVIVPGRGPQALDLLQACGEWVLLLWRATLCAANNWVWHKREHAHMQDAQTLGCPAPCGLAPTPPQPRMCRAAGAEVVVNRLAGEAVLQGAHVFAPGLLAATPALKAGDLVAVTVAVEQPGGCVGGFDGW